ncbi:hypothetical protein BCR32DRAFT_295166 [Anaeromyces robustus]|uniref:SH3 domain-containing protein n=1 Tax=Anaeromyces robustus TaxID=1754192 RepID=A0A1Y1WXE0_9FUNG|nr:hypothetical protein BCR32DRAFT_295166 [Anaeromyces robustus]|eukprot:ORX78210.1 hypothetical protein BCR32DRAFT_295166 [Anaeromyces robustus]
MKSIFVTALATICLLCKQGLAYENVQYANTENTVNQYQNQGNYVQNNNNYENSYTNSNINQNNAVQNNQMDAIETMNQDVNQYINQNLNNNNNLPVNNYANTNINYNNNVPQQQQQQQPTVIPETQKEERSNTSSYVLGGIGFTGVAFIAAFGYKNYKKSVDLNKFKEEILTESSAITKPEKAKKSNTLTRLSRSLSLSFVNRDDAFIDDKPVVSESLYSKNFSLTKNRAYKCHVAWTPLVSDEIILRRGDLVCVKESFSDGYSLGRNLSTKFDGIFPTCCLTNQKDQIMGSELIKNGKFVSILKRTTSKNKAKRTRRASSVSAVLPSWVQKTELTSILTQ